MTYGRHCIIIQSLMNHDLLIIRVDQSADLINLQRIAMNQSVDMINLLKLITATLCVRVGETDCAVGQKTVLGLNNTISYERNFKRTKEFKRDVVT